MSEAQPTLKHTRRKAERRPNERLKAQRLKKNWTQVYVATTIGTSDVEVSRWETGAAVPTLYFREHLCALFGRTPEELGLIDRPEIEQEEHFTRLAAHLSVPLTLLIGRKPEVTEIDVLLQHGKVRLLTLTGPGGVGKTHLALHIANQLQKDYENGVSFVSLAPLQDAGLVVPTIAQTLGLQGSGTRSPLELLKMFLRKKHLLLVLDNFEHLLDAALPLVEVLTACPRLQLLVTSREELHVRGERVLAVQPLALPDLHQLTDHENVAGAGAVALFLERAREIIPDLALTSETTPLIVEICRRLDGLPLALELAATRLKLFPLPALLQRLEHRFHVLVGGPRDLPARQQTLHNTLQWSYELLSPAEQHLFRVLSVFVGGCTLEALEAIANALTMIDISVLDGITSLLDKHLLYRSRQEGGELRLLMLETIREYALECLSTCGELEQTCLLHGQYYLRLAEEAEAHFFGKEQARWVDRLECEQDNLRAALHWSLERAGEEENTQMGETASRLAVALVYFWALSGSASEGRAWLEQALAKSVTVNAPVRVKALSGAAWFAFINGEVGQALRRGEECLQEYRYVKEIMTTRDRASSLFWVAWLAMQKNNEERVHFLLEESRVLARYCGDPQPLAQVLYFLAQAPIEQGKYTEARSLLEESLTLFREQHNNDQIAWISLRLGSVLFALDEEANAGVLVANSLHHFQETQNKLGATSALYLLGQLAFAQDEVTKARTLFEEALQLIRASGLQNHTAHVLFQLAGIAFLQGDHSTAVEQWEESLTLLQQGGYNEDLHLCLQHWGCLMAQQGDTVWAARLWGVAERFSEVVSRPNPFAPFFVHIAAEHENYERAVNTARRTLGEHVFVQTLAEGRTMTLEHVLVTLRQSLISDRLRTKATPNTAKGPSPASSDGLTSRERGVLRLLANDLTRVQIAEELAISPRTVDAHLRSIYSKLNISSRHAAIRYARECHLV